MEEAYEDPQFAAEEQEAQEQVVFAQPLEKLQVRWPAASVSCRYAKCED